MEKSGLSMEQIISIAQQLPVVALFIWFVLRRDKEWRDVLDKLTEAIHSLAVKLEKVSFLVGEDKKKNK